jgi:16S rRNA (guanine1207-N2)-methyltransferase
MDHYFSDNPIAKSNKKEVKVTIGGKQYTFITDSNVFSKDYIDYGTKLLLEFLPINTIKGRVLDLGCGYGPVGIYIAINTDSKVDMVDVNNRAIELATLNSRRNDVTTNVYLSNVYSGVKGKYDYIITNPPIRAGKKVVYEMLFDAKKYLNNNGELWLVVRKQQGAKTIFRDLQAVYNAEVIEKDKGYYVIKAVLVD